ncbi:MAG TPA: hypothetical protein VIL31_02285, partial [Cyclobacteriaceae bacterium]
SASFRFRLATDTLAFDYRIPVITAPSGLEDAFLAPVSFTTCPAHQTFGPYGTMIHSLKA